jgi:hypothetical protein
MNDAWFALYHQYSTARHFDARGLHNFEKDIKFAQEIGVKTLILEDYYANFVWGEYTELWNEKTFRKMRQITQDYGIRFLPYMDVTELAIHGKMFPIHGKEWIAKNRWGKGYSAFSSFFLPAYYKTNFHTKLMCPASSWGDYFVKQAHLLLTDYETDGIYLDRMDYRVTCYDHSKDPEHFIQGIPVLVKRIQQEVKATSIKNILIINDSCVNPDATLIKCMEAADFVLTELLPVDTDPKNFYWQFLAEWGDVIWAFRRLLRPLMTFFMNYAFKTEAMTNETRLQQIINRLKPYVGQNIIFFSHRRDYEGFKAMRQISHKNQLNYGYVSGLELLQTLRPYFEREKEEEDKITSF